MRAFNFHFLRPSFQCDLYSTAIESIEISKMAEKFKDASGAEFKVISGSLVGVPQVAE
jgi:hypothetical protein